MKYHESWNIAMLKFHAFFLWIILSSTMKYCKNKIQHNLTLTVQHLQYPVYLILRCSIFRNFVIGFLSLYFNFVIDISFYTRIQTCTYTVTIFLRRKVTWSHKNSQEEMLREKKIPIWTHLEVIFAKSLQDEFKCSAECS